MKTSYSFLRNLAEILKWFAYIQLLVALIIGITILFVPESPLLFTLSLPLLISCALYLLSLLVASALITLLCDIADNTRRSADALERKVE